MTTSFPRNKDDEAGVFIARLVNALSDLGVYCFVSAPHGDSSALNEKFHNYEIARFKYGVFKSGKLAYGSGIMPNLKINPLLVFQVPGLLLGFFVNALKTRSKWELIHANWIACMIPGLLLKILSAKPLIVTIRGVDLKLLRLPMIGFFLKVALARCDQITTVSQPFKEKLREYFPNKNIALIQNGVSTIVCSDDERQDVLAKYTLGRDPYAVFAGRVIPLKRIEILIQMLSLLKSSNLKLVICGSIEDKVYLSQLESEVDKHKLGSRVKFLGSTAPDEYLKILSGAQMYWSASEYEGRPNSVLEAMAHGIPIALSDIPAHRALVQDKKFAILLDEKNLTQSVFQIEMLLNDKLKLLDAGRKAQEAVAGFTWHSCAKEYLEIYKALLSR